ncbi:MULTISPECIES: metal-dependent hydrolase [Actinoalloteichus]|uniref:metal-dependent hydrolase n=1 Tax=Actinoalloteichus TaxID=65496 RepID=UPI0026D61541
MNNGGHSTTGLLAGVGTTMALAPLAGVETTVPLLLTGGLVAAGAALLPDIDHDGSTVSRSGGALTALLASGAQSVSRFAYRVTRTRHDLPGDGAHRYLTHTPVAALAVGLVVGLAQHLTHWVIVGVLLLCLTASVRSLSYALPRGVRQVTRAHRRLWSAGYAIVLTVVLVRTGATDGMGWPLGAVVAVGMLVHVAGDAVTEYGVPMAWPLRLRCPSRACRRPARSGRRRRCPGRRWHRLHLLPRRLRFRTGSRVEKAVQAVSLLGTGGLLLAVGLTG